MGLIHKVFFGVFVVIFYSSVLKASSSGPITFGHARFTVIDPFCVRMEYQPENKFIDDPSLFAIERKTDFQNFTTQQWQDHIIIDTGKLEVTFINDGKIFNNKNLSVSIRQEHGQPILWYAGEKNKNNLGGTRDGLDGIDGPVQLDDGILARDGWFVLDDQKNILKDNWIANRPKDHGIDWFFFGYGTDFKSALKSYTKASGEVPMPRKYVLGSWYSRWWPYSSDDYKKIVGEFHDHDFPLDNVVMDMDWHKKNAWGGYSWNRSLFPNPDEYLKWIHDQHLHATLNDHPNSGVGPFEDNYSQFMSDFGRMASSGETIPYNGGDQKYISTLFKDMHGPLEKIGIDFWWVDWEGDNLFEFNRLDWINETYWRHSQHDNLRGQQFSRWGGFGDHRHPIHFSGDTNIAWPVLQFEVPFSSTSGNSGAFFWTHDMGGFTALFRNGELLARWVQFGAFSAALRLHSTNKWNLDKRPWAYGSDIENSMRISYQLRSEFFPYTYSSVWQSHAHSIPFIRPLYIEEPEIEESYKNPQEYLYGDNILVAPIVTPGKGSSKTAFQTVYFPSGNWFNWFTGEEIQGPAKKTVFADLNSFPLFIRGGTPVVLQPYTERMGTDPISTLIVRTYPHSTSLKTNPEFDHFTLHEDDGITEDYKKGLYSSTEIKMEENDKWTVVTLQPTIGSFAGQLDERGYIIEFAHTIKAVGAFVDGKVAPLEFDALHGINKVSVPKRSIRIQTTVQLQK